METYILEVKFQGERDCEKCRYFSKKWFYNKYEYLCYFTHYEVTKERLLEHCPLIKQEVKDNEN